MIVLDYFCILSSLVQSLVNSIQICNLRSKVSGKIMCTNISSYKKSKEKN